MSKVARFISQVASVVAVVATFIPGGQPIAAIAGAVAGAAGAISVATQKRPGAQGGVNQVVIGNNVPIIYLIGRTYSGGAQVYDNSSGDKNKYRHNINVLTAAGPIDGFETFLADYYPIGLTGGSSGGATGFYASFMSLQSRLGSRPDSAAYTDGAGLPDWGASAKLSGYASYKVTMKFDKDAKRFAGGVPQMGWVARWVRIYDPRLDSTYPGGSGPQRWDDEGSWAWSENPALHALTYARGRFIEKNADGSPKVPPVKLLGCAFPKSAIDLAVFVEAANLCEANGWTCGGAVYEAPGASKWDNLKRFCQAFAAQPVLAGGRLSLKLSAPRPSLFTLTVDDLAEGTCELRAMKPFQDRRNSIVPRYRSEGHRWEYVQAAPVTVSTYLAEDGELRTEEVQYDLVQDVNQAAELAAYDLVNGREFGPLTLTCKPRLMRFRPGEAGTVTIPELGLTSRKVVITSRQVDPTNGTVTFTFESETDEKHAFALGRTGTAPPTPVIRAPGEIDQATDALQTGVAAATQLVQNSFAQGLTFSVAAPSGGSSAVGISAHTRVYADKSVSVGAGTLAVSGANAGDLVLVYYDDEARAGGAVAYQTAIVPGAVGPTEVAYASPEHPYRHFVAGKVVPATGSSSGGTDAGSGGGGGGVSKLGGISYAD